ncbi:MAG: hypothetical protein JXR37_37705 [Kiritimatiellae bacterium]|nr:hypothetical protein [Kiritimatiellia bacterium]
MRQDKPVTAKGAMTMSTGPKLNMAATVAMALALSAGIAGTAANAQAEPGPETVRMPSQFEEITSQPGFVYNPPDPYELFGVEKSGRGRPWDFLLRTGENSDKGKLSIGRRPIGGQSYRRSPPGQPPEVRKILSWMDSRTGHTMRFAYSPINKKHPTRNAGISSNPKVRHYGSDSLVLARWQESVDGKWDSDIAETAREMLKLRDKGMRRVVIGFWGEWGGNWNMAYLRNVEIARLIRQAWNRYTRLYDRIAEEAGAPGFFLFDLNFSQTSRTSEELWREALPLRDGDRKPDFIGFDVYDATHGGGEPITSVDLWKKGAVKYHDFIWCAKLAVLHNALLSVPEWSTGGDPNAGEELNHDNPFFCHLMADYFAGCDGTVHNGKGVLAGHLPKMLWPQFGYHCQFNGPPTHRLSLHPKFAEAFIERFGIPEAAWREDKPAGGLKQRRQP